MFDPADVHIHSTPESHGSNVNPTSGNSRGRGVSPSRPLRITDDPQVSSMRREWHDESQQMKDRVSRLATEVETQADADRMRLIVQRFAGEIVPDRERDHRSEDQLTFQ